MSKRIGNPTDFESFLTWEALTEVLSYDPATGEFRWIKSGRFGWTGRVAGYIDRSEGYRRIEILGRAFYCSRLAVLYMTKCWPKGVVDHKNGNRTDDRWANLRDATRLENRHNRHVGANVVSLKKPARVARRRPKLNRPHQRGKANDFETFLTHETLIEILSYDPVSGVFHWRSNKANPVRIKVGQRAGDVVEGKYADIQIMGRKFRAHRLAFFYMKGRWPKGDIDHINGVKSDNRWENLREATRRQNAHNRGKNANNTSGEKGVFFRKETGKWRAGVGVGGKMVWLGTFETREQAIEARREYDAKHIGKFSQTGAK